jgi:hypothetical protein
LLRSFLTLFFLFVFPALQAEATPSLEELEKWFMSDELEPPTQSSDNHLTFIAPPTDKPTLHSINEITISQQSIKTGWVELMQCYQYLDPVPEMEVVYNYKNLRKLRIIKSKNIEQAFVKGQSVQLENVLKNAQLCISSEVRIFYKNKNGTYQLVNGPFHRQFLDSYFPFHLTLKINYPSTQLKFVKSKPKAQFGFIVKQSDNTLMIDSYFTGKLYTEIIFKRRQ